MNIAQLARKIAQVGHANETRRDGVTPYFEHLEAVANHVASQGHSDVIIAAAYLHDILENKTGVTVGSLKRAGISEGVIEIVLLLTKRPGQNYLDYILAISKDYRAVAVKRADILHNSSDAPTEKQKAKYREALVILNS